MGIAGVADMPTRMLHHIVSNPWIYDQVQSLMGLSYVRRRLAARIAPLNSVALVLGLGGGAGLFRYLWSFSCAYVCLDVDIVKLQAFSTGIWVESPCSPMPLGFRSEMTALMPSYVWT